MQGRGLLSRKHEWLKVSSSSPLEFMSRITIAQQAAFATIEIPQPAPAWMRSS